MPLYDYDCPKCGTFELIQKIGDETTMPCPKCGQKSERKISFRGGFKLIGKGFYENDYKKK